MRSVIKLLLLLPVLAISNSASSEELYSVEDFEIFGVKLGDDAEQVIKGLTENLSVNREDLDIEIINTEIEYVEYRTDDVSVEAYIEPDYHPDTGMAIEGSPFKLTLLWIKWKNDDYIAFGNEMKDKFGPPSSPPSIPSDLPPELLWDHGMFWCEQMNASKERCEDGTNAFWVQSDTVNNSKGRAILVDFYE